MTTAGVDVLVEELARSEIVVSAMMVSAVAASDIRCRCRQMQRCSSACEVDCCGGDVVLDKCW